MDYLHLSKTLGKALKTFLIAQLKEKGFTGVQAKDAADTKGTHLVDQQAFSILSELLKDTPCNIFMEGFPAQMKPSAAFSIFLDPMDGSINWDKGVGDPCLALAITEKQTSWKFSDLSFAYVEGFRSGDYYYTRSEQAFYYSNLLQQEYEIQAGGATKIEECYAYIKTGYSGAERQLIESYPLMMLCRDIRAFDNSGTELAQLARGSADFMVEARQLSDFFNLLAYPIVKFGGGEIYTLQGESIADLPMDMEKQYDFIAVKNPSLMLEIMPVLEQFRKDKKHEQALSTFLLKNS